MRNIRTDNILFSLSVRRCAPTCYIDNAVSCDFFVRRHVTLALFFQLVVSINCVVASLSCRVSEGESVQGGLGRIDHHPRLAPPRSSSSIPEYPICPSLQLTPSHRPPPFISLSH